jgi:hypothetical protein
VLVICILYSEVFLTLAEVFPCFFLSCKANARVKLAKTGHGTHSSKLVVICVVLLLFVSFYVLFVYKCVVYYCHRVKTQLQLRNISYITRAFRFKNTIFIHYTIHFLLFRGTTALSGSGPPHNRSFIIILKQITLA